jgi:hypothetical protein
LARQLPKAIPLCQKAGSLSLGRMALAETIAHLNKGLELVAALPASPERDGKEVDLRILLGPAWIALKGWPAQEVWDSLHPGLALATSLRRNAALLPILFGLWTNVLCAPESLRWVVTPPYRRCHRGHREARSARNATTMPKRFASKAGYCL